MAFGDFDLRRALTDFGLVSNEGVDLFAGVPPVEPGEVLRDWLAEYAPTALGVGTEAARSNYIITPVLAGGRAAAGRRFTILPGVTFEADRQRGLSGVCDYLLTRSAEVYFVRGPLLAVVEAKKEDINGGIGQCAAAMVGIRVFNERDGTPLPAVYGCVTSGNVWKFMKLEGDTLFIDRAEYHLRDLPAILGILVHIVGG